MYDVPHYTDATEILRSCSNNVANLIWHVYTSLIIRLQALSIVGSFLHLMVLFCKVIFNHQTIVLIFCPESDNSAFALTGIETFLFLKTSESSFKILINVVASIESHSIVTIQYFESKKVPATQ